MHTQSSAGQSSSPRLVVLSSLFPSPQQPLAGVFIRERMFRVGQRLSITVVSPQPWFPLQSLLRRLRPGYRPPRPAHEVVDGVEVHRPRFFALPGVLRRLDSYFMARAVRPLLARLVDAGRADIIDAHFAYPDGHAAHLLSRWSGLPYVVTLRGTEPRLAQQPALRRNIEAALRAANRVIGVSGSLRDIAVQLGAPADRAIVVGNGVDLERFSPMDRADARRALGLPPDAAVLISVGGLVERKGFHRVIDCLPGLLKAFPRLHYLVVGGPSPEGDWSERLRAQVAAAGLQQHVHFLGPLPPERLSGPLSAAEVFVLATSNEGWANVFLEAMACGLPVVTTRVGGNAEVVCRDDLGIVVPFGDASALADAITRALQHAWDRAAIVRHAADNTWTRRVDVLVDLYRALAADPLRRPGSLER